MPVVTPLVYPWSIKHETFNCPLVRPTSCLQIHKQEVTNNALPFADARIVLRDYILGSTRTHWLDATPRLNKLAQYVLYRRITLPSPASGQRLEITLPLRTRLVKEQKKNKIFKSQIIKLREGLTCPPPKGGQRLSLSWALYVHT